MLNKDEYQKSVWLKFRYCLEVPQFTISLLITCMPLEEIDFEKINKCLSIELL